ncbi:hypothetical protein H7U37_05135 [Pseudoflavonifractor phocaeensis]|uniref:MaoC/PaaZ C-terminal domain-containing protein n=1 Tax=Pseudoflavonifractor phocaeensis TaxID=1870988 RepID=UPI0019576A70|nr:MaoC/PaaZ C-terminal domain-containing protein [Pseudoflavonifractor phocaeensis]MBM6869296.1 hypothetical protein [Pseudoflavonifractor phocaeensis]MBM6937917.1 hypothetical protein [Pseudoflavonifractor phocaeensis]
MLDQSAVGLSVQQKFSYTWRDIILYNLSVGAGQDTLEYVYEQGLKAIPTFGVIPCAATFGTEPYTAQPVMPTSKIEGLRKEGTLHMDHKLVLYRPIPTEGTLTINKVITGVYDRGEGKGAKIQVEISAADETGETLFTNTMGYLNRWAGGFGGEKPPASTVHIPDRSPDLTAYGQYPANAPLLYRLTGDTFPLHADPAFAKKSGFDRPIVHGLCSLGYACRMLTALLFPGEPERVISLENQFRSVAMPGDSFALQVWLEETGKAYFRMVGDKDGKAILDYGCITYR